MNSINRYLPFDSDWQMDSGERLAMTALLGHLRPKVSLEIGSKYGGSLAVLSRNSDRVVSLDVDPEVPARLARFQNVEFVIGDSRRTLPEVLTRLREEGAPLGFALVDGDHSAEGVRGDSAAFLRERPIAPLYVMMHDSFNPDVRRGILRAGWEACPFVHAFELDLVPGSMKGAPLRRELWGGFALAVLKPEDRTGPLSMGACADVGYRTLKTLSAHNLPVRRAMQIHQLFGGGGGRERS
jgi:hypothetical protein